MRCLALMCIYGIELLADNIAECRANMLEVFADYLNLDESDELYRAASMCLSQNLVHGDALTMRTHDGQPITFAEWGYLGKGKFQRRDFRFDALTQMSAFSEEGSLFAHLGKHEIFTPTKTYPPMTVRELAARRSDDGFEGGRMNDQASFALRGRNPDVLTCIANLSNDEVFTPPEFANRMLDTLAEAWAADHNGANIWADRTVRFLDPCTKSGVFLREITSRLTKGLATEIPDLQKRVDHILTKQVFGIGITHLTSLLARRSVYCSKHANGEHSIAKGFASDAATSGSSAWSTHGSMASASIAGQARRRLDRGEGLETHAYAFIHTDDIKTRVAEMFGGDMQFDVIIGNPPYQLDDGGYGTSAAPIYQLFVEQAQDARSALRCVWSRRRVGWLVARDSTSIASRMLTDKRMRKIVDYPKLYEAFSRREDSRRHLVFPLGPRPHGPCEVQTISGWPADWASRRRYLDAYDVFVRRNEAIADPGEGRGPKRRDQRLIAVSPAEKPFGLRHELSGQADSSTVCKQPVKLFGSIRTIGWVERSDDHRRTLHGSTSGRFS